jgi:hypothetical protein
MDRQFNLRPTLVAIGIAAGVCGVAMAQSTADTPTTSTTTAAAATAAPADGAAAGDRQSATTAPTKAPPTDSTAAQPTTPAPTLPTDANAPIGSTNVVRSDTPSIAFDKLAGERAFLAREDTAALPGFGNAFAHADHDADARLDRTEFTDAWAAYTGQGEAAENAASAAAAAAIARSEATSVAGVAASQ